MSGTNYDKFYVDELVKKYMQQADLDALIVKVKAIGSQPSVPEYVSKFLDIVESEADKAKRIDKEDSAKRNEEDRLAKLKETVKEWTPEEVALLTKGIAKFPPGTVNRWKVVADFVETKNQKEIIQKAKEISEKQTWDIEARRAVEEERKVNQENIKKEAILKVKQDLAEEKKVSHTPVDTPVDSWTQ